MPVYKLVRAVKNPNADRRVKDDWRHVPEWKAGTQFVIDEGSLRLIQVGHKYAVSDPRIVRLIIDAGNSERVEESVLAMLTRLEVGQYHARLFYEFLIRTGRMSAAEFETAWTEWQNEPEDVS